MALKDEILEEILKEYKKPEDLIGRDGIPRISNFIQDYLNIHTCIYRRGHLNVYN